MSVVETKQNEVDNSLDAGLENVFNAVWGESAEPVQEVSQDAGKNLPSEEPQEPEQPITEEPELTEAERIEKLINERVSASVEQIKADLEAKAEQKHQQLTGKLGELNRKILDSANSGKKLTEAQLERISDIYGDEFAEVLKEVFVGGDVSDADTAKLRAELETRQNDLIIASKHRDWEQVRDSDEFRQWVNSLPADKQSKVTSTNNPVEFSDFIDSFKEDSYKNWIELAQIDGFYEWAHAIQDEQTRYRIGRDWSAGFIQAAKDAFTQYQQQNPVQKTPQPNKRKDTRVEDSVLPESNAQSTTHSGTTDEDVFLSVFNE